MTRVELRLWFQQAAQTQYRLDAGPVLIVAHATAAQDITGSRGLARSPRFERIDALRRKGQECQITWRNRLKPTRLTSKQPRPSQPELEESLIALLEDPQLDVLGERRGNDHAALVDEQHATDERDLRYSLGSPAAPG